MHLANQESRWAKHAERRVGSEQLQRAQTLGQATPDGRELESLTLSRQAANERKGVAS